jgi:hypothetical protein
MISLPPGVRIYLACGITDMRKGMDGGAAHWAIAMSPIKTAKLNSVNPTAYLADVLERIV